MLIVLLVLGNKVAMVNRDVRHEKSCTVRRIRAYASHGRRRTVILKAVGTVLVGVHVTKWFVVHVLLAVMRRLLVVAVVRERVVALRHLHLVRVVDQVARRGDNVARIVGWHFEN